MKKDNRGLLAITVSLLVFILWYSFIAPKFWPQEKGTTETVKETVTTTPQANEGIEETVSQESPAVTKINAKIEEVLTTFKTSNFEITLTNYGAVPVDWKLLDYTVKKDTLESQVEMFPTKRLPLMPLSLQFEKASFEFSNVPKYQLVEKSETFVRYRWESDRVSIEKIYTLGKEKYDIDLEVVIKNIGREMISDKMNIGLTAVMPPQQKSGGFLGFLKGPTNQQLPIYLLSGKLEKEKNPTAIKETKYYSGKVFWSGIEDRYFLSAIIPRSADEGMAVVTQKFGEGESAGFYSGISLPETTIAPNGQQAFKFTVYAGPKEMGALKAVGLNLDKAIDYGWFTFIAVPILYTLKFLYSVFHNYGVAIILLTILIRLILHPINKRSMRSMKAMKDLQPQIAQIKEKYKNDKERLNLETMQLFKRYKVNPMSGCLPMLLQFPVYIALYRVLWNSIELYQAPFFWIYKDLSQPDPYYITPALLGIAFLLQQKLTPSATADPTQQKMMYIMPVMFTLFMAFLPVGLVVYILVSTLIGVAQQWMNNNNIHLRDLIRGKMPGRVSV